MSAQQAFIAVLEAACWRAHELDAKVKHGLAGERRGAKAELTRIRRAVRVLVDSRAQRDRLLAITRSAS